MLRSPVLVAFPSRNSDLWTQRAVLAKHAAEPLFELGI
jgi:hypothetical protein